ncbi:uncharacterized protein GIQ15_02796 [Arthroderma uncinatum]|uniref:uncharacterized protein n=1 Tax=Arthroderma uncinatum TaxID=74035 RepID=UPI00144AA033|nr:uncharacterized protein GIQ15_02796 [Arthroderma uncinatum]KAF3483472.1 hypothetical protein GIQ15_02796 [Arthroderma uncinatum]
MTSGPIMETEERSASPMSSSSWTTLGEFDSLSNDGSGHDSTDTASLIEGSLGDDVLSLDGNDDGSERSFADIDGISNSSETPSLVTPSLTHTDDDYNDVEHEYEDEDEHEHGTNVATPSGWGSTPDLAQDEYEEDQRVAEENRVYMHSHWVSTSSLDEAESEDEDAPEVQYVFGGQGGDISDVRAGWNSTSTSTEFTQPNRITEADKAVLKEIIESTTQATPRGNITRPTTAASEKWKNRGLNKPGQEMPFLMKAKSVVEAHADILIVMLFSLIFATLMTMVLGYAWLYLKAGIVFAFQGCMQLFGLFSGAQEGASTGKVQTAVTPTATPVISVNAPVFSTSPKGGYISPVTVPKLPDVDSYLLQLSWEIRSHNETEDVQVHAVGDNHVIVRLPSRLASGKRSSKFDIKVTRDNKDVLPFELYKLFDGVFTLRLAPEDAYGPMNVTVSTKSKPLINQTTSIDFGTPWLKVASWKKATQLLSKNLREDFNFAQTEFTKIYIKLTLDLQNICGTVCGDTNQYTTKNGSFRHVITTAKGLLAKLRAISDSFSLDDLMARAKILQYDAEDVVNAILAAAQKSARQIRAHAFHFDLKTKFRDICKHPALSAAQRNARSYLAKVFR